MRKFYTPKQNYKVIVRTITYNQSNYIADTLYGIAMQYTNFPFLHYIIDDCSTDGEQEIIKSWINEHCDMEKVETVELELSNVIIVPHKENNNLTYVIYLLKQNLYKKSELKNKLIEPLREHSEYEAICEGDDYWTDPFKLQKQVDYLEVHPGIVYSCHRYNYIHDFEKSEHLHPNKYFDNPEHCQETEFVFDKKYAFMEEWITKTLTCVYRQSVLPKDYTKGYKYVRDVHMVYHLLCKGKGVCHNFVGGTYRLSHTGIYAGQKKWRKNYINYKVYLEIYKKTHDKVIKEKAEKEFESAIINGKPLGIPTHIIEYNAYRKLFGINPLRLFIILKRYHRPLFE